MACSSIGRLDCFQARVVRRVRFKAKCAEPQVILARGAKVLVEDFEDLGDWVVLGFIEFAQLDPDVGADV